MSEFEKEAEAATAILLAMSGEHQPADTEEAEHTEEAAHTEDKVSDIMNNIHKAVSNAKDSANLAGEVQKLSLKQLSSWVKNISDGFNIIKNIVKQSVVDGAELTNNYKVEVDKFASKITSAYAQLTGKVESGLETVGLKEQLDNIMLQHEKMLFIALQLVAHKNNSEELLEPNIDNIPTIVNGIVDDKDKMTQVMIHVNKLFETFYYGKLGVSAVNSYNIVESDTTNEGDITGSSGFFARSNKDLIDKYNTNEIKKIIDSTVENNNDNNNNDNNKLKEFLVNFITNFNFDNKVESIDHSKYFGYSQTLPEFVKSILDFNNDNINFIDFELSKKSIKSRLDYYADRFNTGGSLLGYAKNIKDLYSNYKELIEQTISFIEDANLTYFGYPNNTDSENIKNEAKGKAEQIRDELVVDYNDFINEQLKESIGKIRQKTSKETVENFLTESDYNKEDGSKKRPREPTPESSNKNPRLGPGPGPDGGRKRKTRVAANKKRKTQKKKRPSRKMKVSRKKTQRRKKKGSKKKSMKNRK